MEVSAFVESSPSLVVGQSHADTRDAGWGTGQPFTAKSPQLRREEDTDLP